jgi:anaerobic ribonucleoside-triphosphate reductase
MDENTIKLKNCNEICEVYSRVTGYFRPTKNWNVGKQEEFKFRKPFKQDNIQHMFDESQGI